MDIIKQSFKRVYGDITEWDNIRILEQCNTINNNLVDYYQKVITMIESQSITQKIIDEHDHSLNTLYGNILVFLGFNKVTENDLDNLADKYLTQAGLGDSEHYMERGWLLERYYRIATKELVSFGLIPNPNYKKIFGNRTIYYSDIYRAWLKGEILDIFTNVQYMRQELLKGNREQLLDFTFGLMVTINILLKTTETKTDIPWSDI